MKNIQKERLVNQKILIQYVVKFLSSKKLYEQLELELCYAPFTTISIPVETFPSKDTLLELDNLISNNEMITRLGEDTQIKFIFDSLKMVLVLVVLVPYEGEYFDIDELVEVDSNSED